MAAQVPLISISGGFRRMQVGDTIDWSLISGEPTTLAGYGITDGVSTSGASFTGNVTADVGGGAASNTPAIYAKNGSQRIGMFGNLATGSWNSAVVAGDIAMIYDAGSSGSGNFLIGGWGASSYIRFSSAAVTIGGLTAPGATFSSGINFGSVVAASANDLSKHVQLHGAGYGISITASTMNYVVGSNGGHKWYVNGTTNVMTLDNSGNLGVAGAIATNGKTVGYLGVAYANKTASYTFQTSDRDLGAAKNTATAITFTLPTSPTAGDVYPFANINASGNLTIAPGTGGTTRLAGTATTGNRTCVPWGLGSATCVVGGASPVWLVTGAGVT